MSLLGRLKGLFWHQGELPDAPVDPLPVPEETEEAAGEEEAPEPDATGASPQQPQEQELRQLVQALHEAGVERPTVDTRRVEELVSYLVADGWTRTAVDLLRQLTRIAPHLHGLRLRLAELLYDLGDHAAALELLLLLAEVPQHRVRAHFLLGDFHGREGDAHGALRHYEQVLALDFGYPRARARADDLRRKLDRPVATASPTIFGAEDLGPGGRFVLQRELGRGGGGTVYLAVDQSLDRPVAVKVLHPHVARRQEARIHLFCEARIAAALRHPGIVTIYDLDESLNLVVMEHCAGGALAGRVLAPAPPSTALRRLVEITSVLDTVHRCGVIHRDLKPGNLLLRTDDPGAPLVLTDFGIAHAGELDQQVDASAAGSLVYMAPEQRRGVPVDPRADLFACGVILLEMLLGRPPLDRQQAMAGAVLLELDEVWRELEQKLPASARAVIELARDLVAPDPDHRPTDAAQVSRAASSLAEACLVRQLRSEVLQELRQRGGDRPSAPVERWLAQAAQDLDLS